MGTGKQSIIEGGGKGKDNEAEVSGQALHVKVVSGGGSGPTSDVNIAAVGGNAVTTTVPVSGTVSVVEPVSVDDNGGSLTVDGTVAVSGVAGTVTVAGTVAVSAVGGTVTVAEPVSVDDNGGSLTVDFTQPVSTITPYSRGSTAAADHFVWPSGVVRTDTLSTIAPAVNQYMGARCNSRGATWVKHDGLLTVDTSQLENDVVAAAHPVFPAGAARDDALATLGVADGDWTDIRVNSRGALWTTYDGTQTVQPLSVLPVRQTNQLHNAQVFNNVTTSANGTSLSTSGGRWFLIFFDITVANAPTSIRLIPQFSHDGGGNWYDYSVDQWVDLRYVPGQMPLHECVPLNYVGGDFFRVRIDAVGTTAAATFTVSLWVEVCD